MGNNLRWLAEDLSAILKPLGAVVPHSLVLLYLRITRVFMLVSAFCAAISFDAAVDLSLKEISCAAVRLWTR